MFASGSVWLGGFITVDRTVVPLLTFTSCLLFVAVFVCLGRWSVELVPASGSCRSADTSFVADCPRLCLPVSSRCVTRHRPCAAVEVFCRHLLQALTECDGGKARAGSCCCRRPRWPLHLQGGAAASRVGGSSHQGRGRSPQLVVAALAPPPVAAMAGGGGTSAVRCRRRPAWRVRAAPRFGVALRALAARVDGGWRRDGTVGSPPPRC